MQQVFLAKDRMFKDRQVAIKKERGSGGNREKTHGEHEQRGTVSDFFWLWCGFDCVERICNLNGGRFLDRILHQLIG